MATNENSVKNELATSGNKVKTKAAKPAKANGKGKPAKAAKPAKGAAKAKPAKGKPAKAGKPEANAAGRFIGQGMGKVIGITRVPADAKIKVVQDNPYREGSKAHATFLLFAKGKTVAGVRELAAKKPDAYDVGYLRYAARDGFIKFV